MAKILTSDDFGSIEIFRILKCWRWEKRFRLIYNENNTAFSYRNDFNYSGFRLNGLWCDN